MYMKQIVITIVAAVMFSMTAMAQDQEKGNKKEEMIKHRTEMMVKDYNLDEKQAKQLLELNTKYADKIRPRHHGPHGRHHGMKGGSLPRAIRSVTRSADARSLQKRRWKLSARSVRRI